MADIGNILDDILDVAEQIAPVVQGVSGGTIPATQIVTAGRAVQRLLTRAQETLGDDAPADLAEKAAELERRLDEVDAHAGRTIQALGGQG